jgi:hypothetical protein
MKLAIHFRKRGHKFGAVTEADYEQMAETFIFGPMDSDTHDCIRSGGQDRLRFKHSNFYLGIEIIALRCVRTFFPVEPQVVARWGGAVKYQDRQCKRRFS